METVGSFTPRDRIRSQSPAPDKLAPRGSTVTVTFRGKPAGG
jgi:hypothetical protein